LYLKKEIEINTKYIFNKWSYKLVCLEHSGGQSTQLPYLSESRDTIVQILNGNITPLQVKVVKTEFYSG